MVNICNWFEKERKGIKFKECRDLRNIKVPFTTTKVITGRVEMVKGKM